MSTTGKEAMSQVFQRRTRGGLAAASGRPRAAPGAPVENLDRGRPECVLSGAVHALRHARDPCRRCDHRLTPGSGPAAVLASIYAVARAAGLSDLGRRVDLVERSVRRGEGDPELARALKRGTPRATGTEHRTGGARGSSRSRSADMTDRTSIETQTLPASWRTEAKTLKPSRPHASGCLALRPSATPPLPHTTLA